MPIPSPHVLRSSAVGGNICDVAKARDHSADDEDTLRDVTFVYLFLL